MFLFSTFAHTMEYKETDIKGVWIIEPKVFNDARGYFMEAWKKEEFEAHVGKVDFVQDNESKSSYGVLRGLHYQKGDFSQAKLVRVIKGRVVDVAVDIRKSSPTFGKYVMVELSEENKRQLFIPRGFAHGFLVLSQEAIFAYKVDNVYAVLAGLIIFPAAFSVGIQPDAGPSLIFITLPNVFQQAFANVPFLAYICSVAFYVLLALAALTSTISLHEVSTAFLHEKFHFTRGRAACIVTGGCLLIGVVSSLALGEWSSVKIGGLNMFDALDYLTAKIMLPVCGMFAAVFVGWVLDKSIVKGEVTNYGMLKAPYYPVYLIVLKFVAPIGILAIFINELGLLSW